MRLTISVFLLFQYSLLIGQENFTSGGVLRPIQSKMDIIHYDVHLDVYPDRQFVDGKTKIKILTTDDLNTIELDLVQHYTIESVKINGEKAGFEHSQHRVLIPLAKMIAGGKHVEAEIDFKGKPPVAPNAPWTGGYTWAKDPEGNHWIGTSCPNEGIKIMFPCKDHPSDRPDSVLLHISVPEDYYVAANGILEATESQEQRRYFHWITRYPISNYNINITIGKLIPITRTYTTIHGNQMPVVFYVLESQQDKAEKHLDLTVDNLRFHEKYWGEYPFWKEKFGLAHTPYLGMEHQTINAYGNGFKYTYVRGHAIDWLLLHEMGHEWWANKISIKDWSDYWIHEGITSYADALYMWEHFGDSVYHAKMAQTRSGIQNKKPIIPRRNADTDLVYQGDIYSKGAYLMHSLRFVMGDKAFFKALKDLATNPAYNYENLINTEDVIKHLSQYSSFDIRPFMNMMLYTTELIKPKLESRGNGQWLITLEQADYPFPLEIISGGEYQRLIIPAEGLIFTSEEQPILDPQKWYLHMD